VFGEAEGAKREARCFMGSALGEGDGRIPPARAAPRPRPGVRPRTEGTGWHPCPSSGTAALPTVPAPWARSRRWRRGAVTIPAIAVAAEEEDAPAVGARADDKEKRIQAPRAQAGGLDSHVLICDHGGAESRPQLVIRPEGPGCTRLRALTLSHAVGPNPLPQARLLQQHVRPSSARCSARPLITLGARHIRSIRTS
jgi:hypothetical protein